jgi:hypothetical protein
MSLFGGNATRSMRVERRKRAAYLGGECAFATPQRGCARAVGGYFERDLVHPACVFTLGSSLPSGSAVLGRSEADQLMRPD